MNKLSTPLFCIIILLSTPASGDTVYNGDILKGRKVITELDVTDLERGKIHELFFRAGGENNTGQYYYVPVSVIRGTDEGKRALFVAGVHANEMNSYLTANLIKRQLNPQEMSGTVTIVHQFNIPGLINDVRAYVPSGPVKVNENLNHQANTTSQKTSGQRYSNSLWNKLLKNNADFAIDMHTANPTTFPLFAYANLSIPEVRTMTQLFDVDLAFNSHSQTTVSGAFNEIGVPSFTIEIGGRDVYEKTYVDRAVSGAVNLLKYLQILPGEASLSERAIETNEWIEVYAQRGGFIVPKVKLMDKVKLGDLLFVQYGSFGEIVAEYTSPADGIVAQVVQNPMAEAGTQLSAIVFFNPDKDMEDNTGAGSITSRAKFETKK